MMEERIFIEDFIKEIQTSQEQFGIGLHGIHSGSSAEKEEVAKKILESGLDIQHGWKSVLGTAISLGSKTDKSTGNDIINYRYGNGEQYNVIILSPLYIQNYLGKKIFLGFPSRNVRTAAGQYDSHCILDQICSKIGRVPAEFIYGYYNESSSTIMKNPNYYSKVSMEKQEALFEEIKSAMSDFSRVISEAVINGDKKKLEEMQLNMQQRGWKEAILDNAIEMLNQDEMQIKQKSLGNKSGWETIDENEEFLKKKVKDCVEKIPIRRNLWGKSIDNTKLSTSKSDLKVAYKDFKLSDVKYISNENVDACKKALQLMLKLPNEFRPDKLLEEDLAERLLAITKRGRRVITDNDIRERKEIEAEFDLSIASYLMSGGIDVFGRFHSLINNMNRAGMNVNMGKSIVKFGNILAERMEELQSSSARNSKTWNFLLDPVLHVYTVAKSIDNLKWNPREQKAFEEKLVKLGLIELLQEQQKIEGTSPKIKRNTRGDDKTSPDKNKVMQPVLLEQEILWQAICQYMNTGMVPIGFQISEDGELRRENSIEEMRRKQLQKNLEIQRERTQQLVKQRNQLVSQ